MEADWSKWRKQKPDWTTLQEEGQLDRQMKASSRYRWFEKKDCVSLWQAMWHSADKLKDRVRNLELFCSIYNSAALMVRACAVRRRVGICRVLSVGVGRGAARCVCVSWGPNTHPWQHISV